MSGIDLLKFHDIPELPWPVGTLYKIMVAMLVEMPHVLCE